MSDITRSEALKELKEYVEGLDMEYATPFDKAILVAIASLETDEAYQLEYESTAKNDLGVDCISRQALLDKLEEWDWQELYLPIHFKENIVDELPSVYPKSDNSVLEDIKAEIKKYHVDSDWTEDYGEGFDDGIEYSLDVIDKHISGKETNGIHS